jgi:Skp family chaperone for outer membrane proteins
MGATPMFFRQKKSSLSSNQKPEISMQRLHKTLLTTLLAALLLAGGIAYKASAQTPAPAPTPTHLAVINIVKVFAGLDEKKDGEREIEALADQINKDRHKKEDALKLLNDNLNSGTFRQDSPEYRKQQDEVLEASMQLKVFLAVSEQKLVMMQLLKTKSVYHSMNEAIKKYAESHGIALVFVVDDADFAGVQDVNALTSRIAMRKVVYAHPDYDITNKIIETMNAQRTR